jgi:hypothetical protein
MTQCLYGSRHHRLHPTAKDVHWSTRAERAQGRRGEFICSEAKRRKAGPSGLLSTGECLPTRFCANLLNRKVVQGEAPVTKKICFVLIVVLLFALPAITQEPNTAAAQLTTDTPHFRSGDEVSFTMKLNEPLPEGARFDVRLSPVSVNQEITISSQEPSDKDRKEFLLKFKLPDHARGGEWHIAIVYLFLPNVSWTSCTIATNEMKFVVDGPNGPLPSNATATIVKK